jgi:hypothetical protein
MGWPGQLYAARRAKGLCSLAAPKILAYVFEHRRAAQGWRSWFELFLSSRECAGFPFLHRDMCSTHAFSMQIEGPPAPHRPPRARRAPNRAASAPFAGPARGDARGKGGPVQAKQSHASPPTLPEWRVGRFLYLPGEPGARCVPHEVLCERFSEEAGAP